jgi:hypothetical protein
MAECITLQSLTARKEYIRALTFLMTTTLSFLPTTGMWTVLLLARPECLKVLTFNKFPGSAENWTLPARLLLPLFTKKELLSRIRCQTRASAIVNNKLVSIVSTMNSQADGAHHPRTAAHTHTPRHTQNQAQPLEHNVYELWAAHNSFPVIMNYRPAGVTTIGA